MWMAVIAICVASVLIATAASRAGDRGKSLEERALSLQRAGHSEAAERLYWDALHRGRFNVETAVRFIDAHARVISGIGVRRSSTSASSLTETQISVFLNRSELAPPLSTMVYYWYAVRMVDSEWDQNPVRTLAEHRPPVRWANHLLARAALLNGDPGEAARRFEKEGLSFPAEARDDLHRAVLIWFDRGAWKELRNRQSDPRYAGVTGAIFHLRLAEHDRDWLQVIRYVWPAGFEGVKRWPVFLAALSGALWFAIASRMGRIGEGVPGRKILYAVSFLLGVLSVFPTLLLITLEESVFPLRLLGQPIPDAIYFVFGVALREEVCKLLFFLPLLPILWRRRSRIEALTCGALVGLGFAAEENIGYFHRMEIADALGRFLTANFLHMSLTALIAVSAFESSRRAGVRRDTFRTVFPLAVLIHGAYDFILDSSETSGFSFLAMGLFILLSRQFLREMMSTCAAQRQRSVLRTFVVSLVLLTGVSYVYASTLVGPMRGVAVIGSGLLGVGIMIYVFVRELAY